MTVIVEPTRKVLILEVDAGVVNGKRVTKPKRYTLRNTDVTSQNIFDLAVAFSTLMEDEVEKVKEEVQSFLVAE